MGPAALLARLPEVALVDLPILRRYLVTSLAPVALRVNHHGLLTTLLDPAGARLLHAGLALATTLSACLNAGLLFRGLVRDGVYRPSGGWSALAVRGLLASVSMGAAIWIGTGDLSPWFAVGTWERVMRLTLWIAVGGVVYFAVLFLSGVRPRHFRAQLEETG